MTTTTPILGATTFNGKIAFVTGAAGGIGRATALAFAGHGAAVAVSDLDQGGADEPARLVEQGWRHRTGTALRRHQR